MIKKLYHALFSDETRFWIYKLRHKAEVKSLRSVVNPSDKGDFSLRSYDKYECIFVHITKSAGTSVATSLFGQLPYHYTASQYRVIFGRKCFDKYYKFAFVRNPWDRLYSAYSYLKGGGWNDKDQAWTDDNIAHITNFNDFVLDWLNLERLNSHIHFWPQSKFLCDSKGEPIVDKLYYFETIQTDFSHVTNKLQLDKVLQNTNASKRESYRIVYNSESIAKVYELYKQDIENFGYHFDSYDRKDIVEGRFVEM
jgi:hypothetical protein